MTNKALLCLTLLRVSSLFIFSTCATAFPCSSLYYAARRVITDGDGVPYLDHGDSLARDPENVIPEPFPSSALEQGQVSPSISYTIPTPTPQTFPSSQTSATPSPSRIQPQVSGYFKSSAKPSVTLPFNGQDAQSQKPTIKPTGDVAATALPSISDTPPQMEQNGGSEQAIVPVQDCIYFGDGEVPKFSPVDLTWVSGNVSTYTAPPSAFPKLSAEYRSYMFADMQINRIWTVNIPVQSGNNYNIKLGFSEINDIACSYEQNVGFRVFRVYVASRSDVVDVMDAVGCGRPFNLQYDDIIVAEEANLKLTFEGITGNAMISTVCFSSSSAGAQTSPSPSSSSSGLPSSVTPQVTPYPSLSSPKVSPYFTNVITPDDGQYSCINFGPEEIDGYEQFKKGSLTGNAKVYNGEMVAQYNGLPIPYQSFIFGQNWSYKLKLPSTSVHKIVLGYAEVTSDICSGQRFSGKRVFTVNLANGVQIVDVMASVGCAKPYQTFFNSVSSLTGIIDVSLTRISGDAMLSVMCYSKLPVDSNGTSSVSPVPTPSLVVSSSASQTAKSSSSAIPTPTDGEETQKYAFYCFNFGAEPVKGFKNVIFPSDNGSLKLFSDPKVVISPSSPHPNVYRSYVYGQAFSINLKSYTKSPKSVVLGFAEIFQGYCGYDVRVFQIIIGSFTRTVDVFREAGCLSAFNLRIDGITPSANGTLSIVFTSLIKHAMVSGLCIQDEEEAVGTRHYSVASLPSPLFKPADSKFTITITPLHNSSGTQASIYPSPSALIIGSGKPEGNVAATPSVTQNVLMSLSPSAALTKLPIIPSPSSSYTLLSPPLFQSPSPIMSETSSQSPSASLSVTPFPQTQTPVFGNPKITPSGFTVPSSSPYISVSSTESESSENEPDEIELSPTVVLVSPGLTFDGAGSSAPETSSEVSNDVGENEEDANEVSAPSVSIKSSGVLNQIVPSATLSPSGVVIIVKEQPSASVVPSTLPSPPNPSQLAFPTQSSAPTPNPFSSKDEESPSTEAFGSPSASKSEVLILIDIPTSGTPSQSAVSISVTPTLTGNQTPSPSSFSGANGGPTNSPSSVLSSSILAIPSMSPSASIVNEEQSGTMNPSISLQPSQSLSVVIGSVSPSASLTPSSLGPTPTALTLSPSALLSASVSFQLQVSISPFSSVQVSPQSSVSGLPSLSPTMSESPINSASFPADLPPPPVIIVPSTSPSFQSVTLIVSPTPTFSLSASLGPSASGSPSVMISTQFSTTQPSTSISPAGSSTTSAPGDPSQTPALPSASQPIVVVPESVGSSPSQSTGVVIVGEPSVQNSPAVQASLSPSISPSILGIISMSPIPSAQIVSSPEGNPTASVSPSPSQFVGILMPSASVLSSAVPSTETQEPSADPEFSLPVFESIEPDVSPSISQALPTIPSSFTPTASSTPESELELEPSVSVEQSGEVIEVPDTDDSGIVGGANGTTPPTLSDDEGDAPSIVAGGPWKDLLGTGPSGRAFPILMGIMGVLLLFLLLVCLYFAIFRAAPLSYTYMSQPSTQQRSDMYPYQNEFGDSTVDGGMLPYADADISEPSSKLNAGYGPNLNGIDSAAGYGSPPHTGNSLPYDTLDQESVVGEGVAKGAENTIENSFGGYTMTSGPSTNVGGASVGHDETYTDNGGLTFEQSPHRDSRLGSREYPHSVEETHESVSPHREHDMSFNRSSNARNQMLSNSDFHLSGIGSTMLEKNEFDGGDHTNHDDARISANEMTMGSINGDSNGQNLITMDEEISPESERVSTMFEGEDVDPSIEADLLGPGRPDEDDDNNDETHESYGSSPAPTPYETGIGPTAVNWQSPMLSNRRSFLINREHGPTDATIDDADFGLSTAAQSSKRHGKFIIDRKYGSRSNGSTMDGPWPPWWGGSGLKHVSQGQEISDENEDKAQDRSIWEANEASKENSSLPSNNSGHGVNTYSNRDDAGVVVENIDTKTAGALFGGGGLLGDSDWLRQDVSDENELRSPNPEFDYLRRRREPYVKIVANRLSLGIPRGSADESLSELPGRRGFTESKENA